MPNENRDLRWSTAVLVGVSVGLSALAFVVGRATSPNARDHGDLFSPVIPAPVSSGRAVLSTPSETVVAPAVRFEALAGTPEAHWQSLSSARRTPLSEKDMAEFLQDLATREPQRAMALAEAEPNNRLCNSLKGAVLHGWATVWPDDAAAWASAQPEGERHAAMEVVLAGAAKKPELAIKLGLRLCANEPRSASDYGQFLIHGLTELGSYGAAVRFASMTQFGNQDALLNQAFSEWASHDPEQALAAFDKLTDLQVRNFAFPGLIVGWVMANPATAAAYAVRMPPGEDRTQVLSQALPQWASRDPLTAFEWMLKNVEPGQDLNAAVSSAATMPNLINQRPELAVSWAENIAEPVLRANTLRVIAQQWVQRDPVSIRRYLETNANLAPADRAALQEGVNRPVDD